MAVSLAHLEHLIVRFGWGHGSFGGGTWSPFEAWVGWGDLGWLHPSVQSCIPGAGVQMLLQLWIPAGAASGRGLPLPGQSASEQAAATHLDWALVAPLQNAHSCPHGLRHVQAVRESMLLAVWLLIALLAVTAVATTAAIAAVTAPVLEAVGLTLTPRHPSGWLCPLPTLHQALMLVMTHCQLQPCPVMPQQSLLQADDPTSVLGPHTEACWVPGCELASQLLWAR